MRQNITPAEMEILQYVLETAPVAVRAVADHFGQTRGLARTTVLSVMENLRRKGHLTREDGPAGYLYSPGLPKAQMQRNLITEFVERSLGGSLSPFVAYLTERVTLTEAESAEIGCLLERLARTVPAADKTSEDNAKTEEATGDA